MANAKMVELLKALISGQNQERKQAEQLFNGAKASEPDSLVLGFLGVVGDEACDEALRRQAAVLLRQLVTRATEKDFALSRMAAATRQQLATELLGLFERLTNPKLQQKVGEVVAKLADACCDKDDQRGWLAPGQRGWPGLLQTVFRLANAAGNSNVACCESAIRLVKDLVPTFKDELSQCQQELGAVVQHGLANQNTKIRCCSLVLVCELVGELDKKDWAPLTATANVLTQVLQQLATDNAQDELQECLQNYLEAANLQPDFFKQQLSSTMEPAQLLAKFVKTRQGLEEGVRSLALEWLVVYTERKSKWLAKSLPNFAALALECCMDFMLEVEDGDDALKEWAERMDDEEGEEDVDELYHNGEEAIDRIVEAMTMEASSAALFALVERFCQQDAWQAKLAALTAVKQTVEYVEESAHMNAMAKLLFQHVEHPHPRVRYTALHAIGQLSNDQAPEFQDSWHQTVMPVLLKKMDDPVDRVAAMAMSAFVSFGEELDNAIMIKYAGGVMEKLLQRLQSTKHRMVQEESITSIAVIAGVIEKDFAQYYDRIMPMLKQLLMMRADEKTGRLRGKAFECMSLLGLAVGKEKFAADAKEAMQAMLQTPLEADDLQREYINEASQRICKCLKKDFAPFLPHILPGTLKALRLDADEVKDGAADDDDDRHEITTADGKLVKVRSSKFEEMLQAAQLLNTYCVELEAEFWDFIPKAAEGLLPLLEASGEMAIMCDEARSAAFQCWASLIKCASIAAKEKNFPVKPTLANDLLRTFLQKTIPALQQDEDPDSLRNAADGLSECLKNVEPGALSGQEVVQLTQQLFSFIDGSFKRTIEADKERKASAAGAPPELQDDEDEEDAGEDEEACRRSLEDAIGSVMQSAPQEFLQCLPECSTRIQQWLATKEHKPLALFLACDIIKNLKELSEQAWPVIMPAVLDSLGNKDADVRIPAAYAVNLAAPLPKFADAAPQAFQRLAQLIGGPAPKKRDNQAKVAMDNCVSAMFSLAKHQLPRCPPDVKAWPCVIAKLPLRDDEDEAKTVHKGVADLLLEQHAGLLGPDAAHLGQVLSCLAEVYKQENLCEKETDAKILRIFHMLPKDHLQRLASTFSEKQMMKIEKMLTAEPVLQHGG
uniref:TOG domain-containing protein n=1 Tax=Zooxanthella nutricula TaxID=1333877 RepID=A0A6U9NR28_9DINO